LGNAVSGCAIQANGVGGGGHSGINNPRRTGEDKDLIGGRVACAVGEGLL
jgi:hypothetical protein